MPSYPHETSAPNGVSRGNLFVESHPANNMPAVVPAAGDRSGLGAPRRRGGGRVVCVGDAPTGRGAARGVSDAARFTRTRSGLGGLLLDSARRNVRRADGNAQRLLGQLAARPGTLIALIAVSLLLLAISWLGLSLRAATAAREHAHQQQRTTAVELEHARARIATLTTQQARAARRQEAATTAAAGTWRAPAGAAQRRLARTARRRQRR